MVHRQLQILQHERDEQFRPDLADAAQPAERAGPARGRGDPGAEPCRFNRATPSRSPITALDRAEASRRSACPVSPSRPSGNPFNGENSGAEPIRASMSCAAAFQRPTPKPISRRRAQRQGTGRSGHSSSTQADSRKPMAQPPTRRPATSTGRPAASERVAASTIARAFTPSSSVAGTGAPSVRASTKTDHSMA